MYISVDSREDFLDKMNQQITVWNKDIDQFQAKLHPFSGKTLQNFNSQIAELRTQLRSISRKYDDLKDVGREDWDLVKAELEQLSMTFTHSFNYFAAEFEKPI